jgi:rubredoxin
MKLLRAICECGVYTRKARVGYHFHQWWFPVLDTSTGQLTDRSLSLPKDQVDLIQLSKVRADALHRPFVESATQELLSHYAGQPQYAFNPDISSTFKCPNCHLSKLRLDQVFVKAFCRSDCDHAYQWFDSEQHGCPKCDYRPHRFEADTDAMFAGHSRTESCCPCSSSMNSASPIDAYCPKCGQLPTSYQMNGLSFCGNHHERLVPYQAPGNFLFIETPSRWVADRFPNAKLWGDADSDDSIASTYCPACELDHQRWLASASVD